MIGKRVDRPENQNKISPFTTLTERVEVVCERCGKPFKVLVDWEWRDRPKHFYCSTECYFEALRDK